ncbi:GNAT family N-acetyltransferase [Maricaulis sp.]|uniref:GNAT family N-acetyltransferase n=1 Tax=Maricaulis sp. TaxID=1486257 RepID=UPI002B272C3B|nr:GNAT family N-acetyltransferase [Maricaulis sp.]
MPVSIREAGRQDLDRIDRIEAESFDADRFARRNLSRMLAGGRTRFLLAEAAEGLGGYIAVSFRNGSHIARIYSLAVAPGARRQGVAEALLDAAGAFAAKRNCRALRLEVRASNRPAVKLYEGRGFRLHDKRIAYYEDGETALVLEASVEGFSRTVIPEQDTP